MTVLEPRRTDVLHQNQVGLKFSNPFDEAPPMVLGVSTISNAPLETEHADFMNQSRVKQVSEWPTESDLPEIAVFIWNIENS